MYFSILIHNTISFVEPVWIDVIDGSINYLVIWESIIQMSMFNVFFFFFLLDQRPLTFMPPFPTFSPFNEGKYYLMDFVGYFVYI